MSALGRVEAALEAARCRRGSSGNWTCPAHEDRSPSLSVKAGGDGRALVHCYAGCDTADVMAADDLTMADLFDGERSADWRPPPPPKPLPGPARTADR